MPDPTTLPEMLAWCQREADDLKRVRGMGDYAANFRALAAILEGMQWRPIADAPKDGTPVLAIGGPTMRCEARVLWWGAGEYSRKTRRYERAWTSGAGHGYTPTHFMPLPPPPAPETDR